MQNITLADSLIIKQIQQENTLFINNFIEVNGTDYTIFGGSHTLFSLAIVTNKLSIVKYLLHKGARIDLIINNISPLMHCAINDRPEIAAYLLKNGAKVDLYNSHKNTALLYASRYGNVKVVKILAQHRANPFLENFVGYNSLDYAIEYQKKDTESYLRDYMARYVKGIFPSTYDGPYIDGYSFNSVKALYMVNDSSAHKVFTKKKSFKKKDTVSIVGIISYDSMEYKVYKYKKNQHIKSEYSNIDNVFAVGDVHGSYDSLLYILKNNQIIDQNSNWSYGDGHLVFIGDLFDRGDKVTEVLWLVYKLWHQAPNTNGKVHVLLGNHEMLILNRDYRYINDKYNYLSRGLNIEYSELFSSITILGNFIRSFNVAVKIDSVLFVHAGISPYIAQKKITLDDLNESVNKVLNRTESDFFSDQLLATYSEAISDKGPFWFRGYLSESNTVSRVTQDEINNVLNFYKVKTMVIGHTEVLKVDTLYHGKLIPINVPFDRVGVKKQALNIISNKFFRSYSNGNKELIMN